MSYSKYSVSTQYRVLFRDSCYIYLLLAGSQIFGLALAFLGVLDLYFEQWGFGGELVLGLKVGCMLAGLASVVVHRLYLRKKDFHLQLFMGEQLLAALGVAVVLLGLWTRHSLALCIGMGIFSVFTFPSFPIMMELIGKRVGKNFDLVATGNVFALDFVVTALIFAGSDFLALEEREVEVFSLVGPAVILGVCLLNVFYGWRISLLATLPFNSRP